MKHEDLILKNSKVAEINGLIGRALIAVAEYSKEEDTNQNAIKEMKDALREAFSKVEALDK